MYVALGIYYRYRRLYSLGAVFMKIAVIGERFIDRYHIGEALRISPEAPIPVVKISDCFDLPGGAENVAANLRNLGADVVEVYPPSLTPRKNRLMVGNTQVARWDEDDWVKTFSATQLALLPKALCACDAIIISDYGKGAFDGIMQELISAIPLGIPIFVDTKRSPNYFVGLGVRYFFPNLKEYAQYREVYDEVDIVLKCGAEGMECEDFRVPALCTNIASVNGAGDTVIAAFVWSYTQWQDTYRALADASAAAAVVCQKPYTATCSREEIYGSR